jgi:hypothetical protein
VTWTKLGDEFADECWTMSDAAFRLHVEGLIWSNRKHLDGRLAKKEMARWAKHPDAASELADVGFWEDCADHFQIVHHLGYQRTAAEWRHQSTVNRGNRAKGKARPVRPKDDSSKGSSDHSSNGSSQSDGSSDERDWSGLDRTGLGKEPNYVSGDGEKTHRSDELLELGRAGPEAEDGNPTAREFKACFTAGADYVPPTTDSAGVPLPIEPMTDADGFPLDVR